MLIGPNVAFGDCGIYEMIESAGADIVIEDVFEGLRDCRYDAATNGGADSADPADRPDPLDALTRARLVGRVPAAFMRSSTGPRFEYISQLIRDFRVQGVIWYELLCCEFYAQDAFFFENRLRELGIPMLTIESNYGDVRSLAVEPEWQGWAQDEFAKYAEGRA